MRHLANALRHPITALVRLNTLGAKLQAAIAALMLGSLLLTILTFAASTNLTQTRLLRAETETEAHQVIEALQARTNALASATELLAADPQIATAIREDSEESLQTLNARAVLVRDRFSAGMIQIYNAAGSARTNLLLSSLYRESSLLNHVAPGEITVRAIEGQIVLLSREDLPNDLGTVITGIDLEKELGDLVRQYRLASEVGLILTTAIDATTGSFARISSWDSIAQPEGEGFPYDARRGRSANVYTQQTQLDLGNSPLILVVARRTEDIRRLTASGLTVTVLSITTTTGLLLLGSLLLMRALTRPIHNLSETAAAVANGDFNRRAETSSATFLKIGKNDEIGQLTAAFNRMVDDLHGLYGNLEARVAARTRELATAADVARTISSSLDLNAILHQTARLIQQRLSVDTVAIYLVEEEDETIVLKQTVGDDSPLGEDDALMLDSQTPVGAAARLHATCVIDDTEASSQYLPTTWYPQMRAIIAVPILRGSDVIGVLELQSATPGVFTPETTNLLNTLCDQIAAGIQNAQRYGDEQRRRRFTEVLELTGRILAGNLDMQQLPRRALSSLHALINYERGALWMTQGDRLLPMAQYGYVDERLMHRKRLSVNADIYARIVGDKRATIIDDVATCDWHDPLWLDGDRSWMGVPIITAKGDVIGLVSLAGSNTDEFDPDDAVWVQAFASQAGIALENAHLYAEIAALNEHRTGDDVIAEVSAGADLKDNARNTDRWRSLATADQL
jgi:GAF domain-containing protein/HAMP domain-containing protein